MNFHVDTETLLVELDQRHHQAAMHQLAASCNPTQAARGSRVRWALGSRLLRLGQVVLGEDTLVIASAGPEV